MQDDGKTDVAQGTDPQSTRPILRALIVEDNKNVRRLIKLLLETNGFNVNAVESGELAMQVLDHQGGDVHLMLADVCLPGDISGVDLVRYCHLKFPHIRILLSSGDTPGKLPNFSRPVEFLAKPFSQDELSAKIDALFAHPID